MTSEIKTFIICIWTICLFILTCTLPVPQLSAIEKDTTIGQRGDLLPAQTYEMNTAPEPPLITAPEEIAEIRDIFDLDIKWSNVPSAAGYHIILARDRSFKNIIFQNAKITGTFIRIRNLDYSTYFLKISSIGKDGMEGPFSDIRSFIIVPHPRSDNPVSVR